MKPEYFFSLAEFRRVIVILIGTFDAAPRTLPGAAVLRDTADSIAFMKFARIKLTESRAAAESVAKLPLISSRKASLDSSIRGYSWCSGRKLRPSAAECYFDAVVRPRRDLT